MPGRCGTPSACAVGCAVGCAASCVVCRVSCAMCKVQCVVPLACRGERMLRRGPGAIVADAAPVVLHMRRVPLQPQSLNKQT
jgi:hypothetical protein